GPMARSAEDLDTALSVLAGPDSDMATAYRLELPAARQTRAGKFRVLVLDSTPLAATDRQILDALETLAGELSKAGATLVRSHPAMPDLAAVDPIYKTLLNAVISRGAPNATPPSAHEWMASLDAQRHVRDRWAEVFKDVDVVLAPVFGSTAFPHIDAPWPARTLTIDNASTPYGDQLAWPSVALLPNLPATAFPAGLSTEGLPIGLQAIGPFLEDRTTIAFAAAVERELGRTTKAPPLDALEPA
ncbi:MAG TPA: amidase family protein, partial [Phenylobacterium sp.]